MSGRGTIGYVSGSATEQIYTYASEPLPTIVQFTTTGANSYTVPAGVTYIIANIIGGGGGTGHGATAAGAGGSSSVAFAAGTITASGGAAHSTTNNTYSDSATTTPTPSAWGEGAFLSRTGTFNDGCRNILLYRNSHASRGVDIRAGGVVTPGETLTVTVGAGGTAGTNGTAGKQGIVTLEYYASNKRRCELGGGGGMSTGDGGGGAGGDTSIAFSAGTLTSSGGTGRTVGRGGAPFIVDTRTATANTGQGGYMSWAGTDNVGSQHAYGADGQRRNVSGVVTPGTGVTVTIGAGAVTPGGGGGSGLAWVEYILP
jgi:hypothetical protein